MLKAVQLGFIPSKGNLQGKMQIAQIHQERLETPSKHVKVFYISPKRVKNGPIFLHVSLIGVSTSGVDSAFHFVTGRKAGDDHRSQISNRCSSTRVVAQMQDLICLENPTEQDLDGRPATVRGEHYAVDVGSIITKQESDRGRQLCGTGWTRNDGRHNRPQYRLA